MNQANIEMLLLEPMLEPFAQSFGEYGTFAVQAFTQALVQAQERHER